MKEKIQMYDVYSFRVNELYETRNLNNFLINQCIRSRQGKKSFIHMYLYIANTQPQKLFFFFFCRFNSCDFCNSVSF